MRIAAIDIGSNSIHIIVCRIRPDLSFEVVDREKDMIRLASGTLANRCNRHRKQLDSHHRLPHPPGSFL